MKINGSDSFKNSSWGELKRHLLSPADQHRREEAEGHPHFIHARLVVCDVPENQSYFNIFSTCVCNKQQSSYRTKTQSGFLLTCTRGTQSSPEPTRTPAGRLDEVRNKRLFY